jgi:hypothetical protein
VGHVVKQVILACRGVDVNVNDSSPWCWMELTRVEIHALASLAVPGTYKDV